MKCEGMSSKAGRNCPECHRFWVDCKGHPDYDLIDVELLSGETLPKQWLLRADDKYCEQCDSHPHYFRHGYYCSYCEEPVDVYDNRDDTDDKIEEAGEYLADCHRQGDK